MAYNIVYDEIKKEQYPLKATYQLNAESLTVHNTYNDASAKNEVAYMKRNAASTSFHAAIDDIEVRIGVPYNRNAWAAGDGSNGKGNRTSIHLEICYSKSGGAKYKAAEENAVQYIASFLKSKNWGIDRVKQHYDWSKKNCPHRIRDEKRWNSFLNRISEAMKPKVVTKPATTPVAKPVVKVTTPKDIGAIKVLVDNLNYYDGPRWTKPTGTVKKNTVLTVIDKIKVDGAWQYKLKSGTYITASEKYVKYTAK